MKKAAVLAFIVLLIVPAVFAQRTTRPSSYQLTIRTNVSGARITVDDQTIKGNVARVKGGSHDVRVQAKGYFDWQQRVNVSGNTTISANLQPIEYSLTINSNVNNADVIINGRMQGRTNYRSRLEPGTYSVKVEKKGYQDFNTNVNLNRDQQIYAKLEPAYAQVNINLPSNILNNMDKNAAGKVDIYIDNNRQKGNSFRVSPGTHRIKIISGGLSVEQSFNFQPGRNYTIEPQLGLTVR